MRFGLLSLLTIGLLSLGAASVVADDAVPNGLTTQVTVPVTTAESTIVPVRWYGYGPGVYGGTPYTTYYNGYWPYGYRTYYYSPGPYYYAPGTVYPYYSSPYYYNYYYFRPRRMYMY